MKQCYQTENQSVLAHGFSVKNYLLELISHLKYGTQLKYQWKIPDWLLENKDLFLSALPDWSTLKLATVFHDCGKPFCEIIDDNGKKHFPNHAEISYTIFKNVFNDNLAAELILHDMDIHLLKADGVLEFASNPNCLVHILIGLAELHSNAAMFGGVESISFKIKWKSLNSRGKQIIKLCTTI